MDISQLQPLAPRSSWFPWRHARPKHGHPALKDEHDTRTFGERIADDIASFGGSWPFIFIFLGLILIWMLVNTLFIGHLLHGKAFDPYPYIALNLVLSALAGLQAPIIMMSQNRSAARDEILAQHHYEETQKIDELLRANTDLTRQIHDLTQKVHALTQQLCHPAG
ncbi:MAG TPA: DUF1003 domain-containing protein [Streptosporangiaceae bacterium]|nr:DUF1003 domain-containing protein [Streptosporangiaceae bacterium]